MSVIQAIYKMTVIYKNIIKSSGSCVSAFQSENIFILFGSKAPDTLKDYCYGIDVKPVNGTIEAGQIAEIDGKQYKITAVGNLVVQNLSKLGHVTFSFTGETQAKLPGTIYLEKSQVPQMNIGSKVIIHT